MPEIRIGTKEAWGLALLSGMIPRLDGSLIQTPDNLIENGDLVDIDANGQPTGGQIEIGLVPTPDGQVVLAGVGSDVTVQNTSPLPKSRTSYVQDGPLILGAPPASPETSARIPKPDKPVVTKVPAAIFGYPQTTVSSPLWLAWGWEIYGRHTPPGPATSFQLAQGQGIKASLPQSIPQGVTGIDLYLSEPGKSTATDPGILYGQRTLPVNRYRGSTYNLPTAFRRDHPAPTTNETMFGAADSPIITRGFAQNAVPGNYQVAIQGRTAFGTTPVGILSPPQTISGPGNALVVTPRNVPSSWTGYRVLVFTGQRWYAAVDTYFGGAESFRPLTGEFSSMTVGGSKGDEQGGTDADGNQLPPPPPSRYILSETEVPREDTSGIAPPDSAPDTPASFGPAIPVGRLTFRVADTYRGVMGPASDPVTVNVEQGEMAKVSLRTPTNLIPNPRYAATGADGMPLDHSVSQNPNVRPEVTGQGLSLTTLAPLSATTELTSPGVITVDPTRDFRYTARLEVADPPSGVRSGAVETVIQQLDATGVVLSERVVATSSLPGDYAHEIHLVPVGTTLPPGTAGIIRQAFYSTAVTLVRVAQRLTPALGSGHLAVVILMSVARAFAHSWPIPPDPPTETQPIPPPPPGGVTVIEEPRTPPIPGETLTIPDPQRMRMNGTIIEDQGFEGGVMPPGWTPDVGSGATLTVDTASAIEGTYGLHATKSAATASPTRACAVKSHSLPSSFFEGFKSSFMPKGAFAIGYLDFNELRRADGRRYAWLRQNSAAEVKKIAISSPPTASGNISIGLEGVTYDVPAVSQREIETFDITIAPTSYGVASITLHGGQVISFTIGGRAEVKTLRITSGSPYSVNVTVRLDDTNFTVPVVAGETAAQVANRIRTRAGGYTGYTVSGAGQDVIFTATSMGDKPDASYSGYYGLGPEGYFTTTTQGLAAQTREQIAAQIRAMSFAGWSISGSGTQVILTANTPGARTAGTFNPGTTGAAASVTITAPGGQDTINDLASRIRAKTFVNWTTSGADGEVLLTSTTSGAKPPASLSTVGTGVEGSVSTPVPGGSGDILVCFRDEFGNGYYRKIFGNISTTVRTNVDLIVAGAGTKRASIYAFGSTGTDPKRLLAYWENIDLSSYPASQVALGITAESNPTMTWEVYLDSVKIRDRGEVYFREHNSKGKKIGQLRGFYLPSQPVSQGILVKQIRIPVLPNQTYAPGFVGYFENLPTNIPAKPLYAEFILEDGTVQPIGDLLTLANGSPLTGTRDWAEYTPAPITTPSKCYEVRIHSRDMSSGTFILQELAFSPGATVKRTGLYAANSSFRATMNRDQAKREGDLDFTRKRLTLGTEVEVPSGMTSTITYRSAPSVNGPWSPFVSDPSLVPDQAIVQVNGVFTGNGTNTVVARGPSMEYLLMAGGKPVPTLLRPDRSELPGGVLLTNVHKWTRRPRVNVSPQYSGKVRRQRTGDSVGHQKPCDISLFSHEAHDFIEENWGPPDELKMEALGWLLSVKLTEQPNIERTIGTLQKLRNGEDFALHKGKLAYSEVTDARPFGSMFG